MIATLCLTLSALTAGCSFSAKHALMAVTHETASTSGPLANEPVVYLHELRYACDNPGVQRNDFRRTYESERVWLGLIAGARDIFARQARHFWQERKVRPRLVFVSEHGPAPPGFAIQPVIHGIELTTGLWWHYGTLTVYDTRTGEERYFARFEVPVAIGPYTYRDENNVHMSRAALHIAHALPDLVATGRLPRPGTGPHPQWPAGRFLALWAEESYWATIARASEVDEGRRALAESRAIETRALANSTLAELSPVCRVELASQSCIVDEAKRVGLPKATIQQLERPQ